jgi:hypothetical protein
VVFGVENGEEHEARRRKSREKHGNGEDLGQSTE